ncbi:MAG: recombinase family protein [Gammaproteobacteria bacterium]|nr:recombinase family protein [Gammaproteobacteria bacterium]MBU2140100.1 recombinase family protein [Gammaproteobacteria bacterium]
MSTLAYVRVSAAHPGEKDQRQDIALAYRIEHWFKDEDLNGSTCILELPGFIELCKLARKGDTVIVSSLECVGCSGPELFGAFHALRKRGVGLKSVRGEFDLSSSVGRDLFNTMALLARLKDRVMGSK